MKFKTWDGSDLIGIWEVSLKIDGVRVVIKDGKALSRAGKPLYNVPKLLDGDYEVFLGTWEGSISATRTRDATIIKDTEIYSLDPIDKRLHCGKYLNPPKEIIKRDMLKAVSIGYEGLVLRQGDVRLKVKPTITHDVPVIGIQMGTGKYVGKVGALVTDMGKVGTGFTDKDRVGLLTIDIGTIIEVESMQLTPNGKFRHPRFVRVRYDK